MTYIPTAWVNGPGGHTPINATNLNKIETALQTTTALAEAAVPKVSTVVRVDDYIPVGTDKTTVDTAAYWRLAITAAGIGGVVTCNGAYKISSELVLLDFQTVEGDAYFHGSGSGITTNFLDFRTCVANGSGEQVGFRLAAGNVFRRLLLVGPGSASSAAYGVASVTSTSSSPLFYNCQFYKWTHGTHLYGAYYTSFHDCAWRYNAVANYADSCYNLKFINPHIECKSSDGLSVGIGIQIASFVRGLSVFGGSIESYATGIGVTAASTVLVSGVYFEASDPLCVNAIGIDCADGLHDIALEVNGCSVYVLNHSFWVKMTHPVSCTLVGHGNKFIYSTYSPNPAPTTPIFYGITTPTTSSVDLFGDNVASCVYVAGQTWGYTDNIFTAGVVKGYNVREPYRSGDTKSSVDLRGRTPVLPMRVSTGNLTLVDTDHYILVNAAGATTQKLPTISGQVPGRELTIKNIGAGTVTVGTQEAVNPPTIEGTATLTTGQFVTYMVYNSNWITI